MSCAFVHNLSNSYEKWNIYNLADNPRLRVFLRSQTYDSDPPSSQCHESIVIQLHDPKYFSLLLFEFSLSSYADCNGVFGSFSSSFSVLSFCSINASWFASYFKIGNSYLSSRSLSFFGLFLHEASTNEY